MRLKDMIRAVPVHVVRRRRTRVCLFRCSLWVCALSALTFSLAVRIALADDAQDVARPQDIEVVIVTAQKREESIQDVPVPVTAISADALIVSDQVRLQDYSIQVPGLNVTPSDARGGALLTIRGVTTGDYGNPTVGVTIDDVPYGITSSLGLAQEVPDLDPNDLTRVEVLRGPQGTLYGASSIGGLFKFVTADPSTGGVSGDVQAGTNAVSNAGELGYNVRGSVNLPLSDTFAIRGSAFSREDPGYIDNVQTGQDGINKTTTDGGRLSALWLASDKISLKLNALIQHATADGSSLVELAQGLEDAQGLGYLQTNVLGGTGTYDKTHELYSATLKANLGWATLDAISGYGILRRSDVLDLPGLGAFASRLYGPEVTGAVNVEDVHSSQVSQEIRLSSSVGRSIDWLVGGYFKHENTNYLVNLPGVIPSTGVHVGNLLFDDALITFKEYAVFADVTYHFTERFDIQMGGREARNEQQQTTYQAGPFASAPVELGDSKDSSLTYLLTPRFKLTPDLMLYARLASGYRPGGFNPLFAGETPPPPPRYAPDKTYNYELGIKADSFEHRLSLDASLYYIDWKNIQLFEFAPNADGGYEGNVGAAKSQGIELSAQARPLDGLSIAAWVAWNDAALTQSFPPQSASFGVSGDRLPFASRFSGNVSLDEQFPLMSGWSGFVGGMLSYVGFRQGDFAATETGRDDFGPYARTDLRAGVNSASWTINIFANNVTNRPGVAGGGYAFNGTPTLTYIQPRTIGLNLVRRF
jgi:iron complex outermembrane recepter protein